MKQHAITAGVVLTVALSAASASELWSSFLTVPRPLPVVKLCEAESCAGIAPAAIVTDAQANERKGGKAVLLTPGGAGLNTEVDLEPGLYVVYVVGRHRGDKTGQDLVSLDVKELKTGKTRSWTMVALYRPDYRREYFDFEMARLYFPAYASGKYALKVSLPLKAARLPEDATVQRQFYDTKTLGLQQPLEPLLVDRLEVRDVLGNCAKAGLKVKRTLTSDGELAEIRKDYAVGNLTPRDYAGGTLAPFIPDYRADMARATERTTEERKARNDELWGKMPDFNEVTEGDEGDQAGIYSALLGHHYNDWRGLVSQSADLYEKTGNPEVGWDAAVMLCAVAEKLPALDRVSQVLRSVKVGAALRSDFRHTMFPRLDMAMSTRNLAIAYDRLFDFIKNNQALADYLGTRISWIKTPQDVTRFLDVNLLQSQVLYDCLAMVPAVQGVCPESDDMLAKGVFSGMPAMPFMHEWNADIEDISFNCHARDGNNYEFLSPYGNHEIEDIAYHLKQYRREGGSPRYDLTNPDVATWCELYEQLFYSGGYLSLGSDFTAEARPGIFRPGWAFRGRSRAFGHFYINVIITNSLPSRVLGAFRSSILESGQFQSDLLKMRGASVMWMRPGLELEMTAHSCLSLIRLQGRWNDNKMIGLEDDTGGRIKATASERAAEASWRRARNTVDVDTRIPLGVCDNTAFAPIPGAQYMEHVQNAAEAGVSLFMRQTAMIDVGDAESYVFDVMRVRGGKAHTYRLNACPGEFTSNMKLQAVPSRESDNWYFANDEDSRESVGSLPAVLQADWAMDPELQKLYQGDQYQADRRVTTRLSLLGREKDKGMVGHWRSDWYKMDLFNLFVQGKQAKEGRESVYPAIIETFAGTPFLGEKRLASVSPAQSGAEASVAVEVKTPEGRVDLLYASVKPSESVTLDGKVKTNGRFAMLSRDAQGMRQMAIVGGTELSAADALLKPDRPGYDVAIAGAGYDQFNFTVKELLPARLLKEEFVNLVANGQIHKFKLAELKAENGATSIRHERTAKFYQSGIAGIDAAKRSVSGVSKLADFFHDASQDAEIGVHSVVGATIGNEKQDKFWKVNAVATDGPVQWTLDGPVKAEDFTDENKDGKTKLSAYLFGPGDRMKTDSHVTVERTGTGEYAIDSNVGCTVGLPRGEYTRASISADGRSFAPIACRADGARLVVALSEASMGDGNIVLRLEK